MSKNISLLLLSTAFTIMGTQNAWSETFTVLNINNSGPGSLRAAILAGNASTEAEIFINIEEALAEAIISLSSPLPIITNNNSAQLEAVGDKKWTITGPAAGIVIDGGNISAGITRNSAFFLSPVPQNASDADIPPNYPYVLDVTLKNLTIKNNIAKGGDGFRGGGGIGGIGGTFTTLSTPDANGSGGGGLGVSGSNNDNAQAGAPGGGGIGGRGGLGDGGGDRLGGNVGGTGIGEVIGSFNSLIGRGGAGGLVGAHGGDGGFGGGGGGGGGGGAVPSDTAGNGGDGGFGGGGGCGGIDTQSTENGRGGRGGFGGGGGASRGDFLNGGKGGFGAGNGRGTGYALNGGGDGGFGGGGGGDDHPRSGGGGAGMGGAIFANKGVNLTLDNVALITNQSYGGISGGSGGHGGAFGGGIFVCDGACVNVKGLLNLASNTLIVGAVIPGHEHSAASAFGSGIFLQGNSGSTNLPNTLTSSLTFSPAQGEVQTIVNEIGDQTGNDPLSTWAQPGSWSVIKKGAGTLVFRQNNTYSGNTIIEGGVINFYSSASFGTKPGPAIFLDGGGLRWASGNTADISARLAPIGNGGTTFATNGNDITFSSPISGTGSITKQTPGTLTFSVNNPGFTGSTTVTMGFINFNMLGNFGSNPASTVTLNGGGLRWAIGNTADVSSKLAPIGANGGIFDTNGNNVTLATAFSGLGSITKVGTGALTLNGNPTYAGRTTISAGSLIFTGDTAGLTGNMLNNAAVTFNPSADSSYSGDISGTGALTKQGNKKLILSGKPTYSGGTNVVDGDLIFTGDTSSLVGNINTDNNVIFKQAVDSSYQGTFTGFGAVVKQGLGVLTFSGDSHTFNGNVVAEEGVLKLTNTTDLGMGTLNINPPATLIGSGTVNNVIVGGTLLLGSSIETFNVTGSYEQQGTCILKVSGDGTSDFLSVGGQVTLGGTLKILPIAGSYQGDSTFTYTLLTSGMGLGGTTFDTIELLAPLFNYQVSYDANNVYLKLRYLGGPTFPVTEGNPGKVADYIAHYGPSEFINSLNHLSKAQLYKTFNELSSSETMQTSDLIANRELTKMDNLFVWSGMERLIKKACRCAKSLVDTFKALKQNFAEIFAPKLSHYKTRNVAAADPKYLPITSRVDLGRVSLWIQGTVNQFSQHKVPDPSGLAIQGLRGTAYDTTMGIDYDLSNCLKVGLTTGYGYSSYKLQESGLHGNHLNSVRLGVYGLWESPSFWYAHGAIYYGHHRIKQKRLMTTIPAVAYQKHDGDHVSGLVEVGKDIAVLTSLTLTPYVGAGMVYLHENRYKETRAGFQNLAVKSRHNTTLQGKSGIQIANLWKWNDSTQFYTFARLGATYRRAIHSHQRLSAAFVGQQGHFTVSMRNKNRFLFNPSIGTSAFISDKITTTIAYEGEYGARQRNNQALLKFNYSF